MPNGDDIAELRDEVDRWKRAHQIACANIAELSSQRAQVVAALTQAILLLDQLMTEMRLANLAPSAGLIFTKAEFDRKMKTLLGQDK